MGDAELMDRALAEASKAFADGAMPIGAILARGREPLAAAHWRGGGSRGLLAHPEHVVMLTLDEELDWRSRPELTLYTTLEPCLMCMGTAMSFRLGRVVYAMAAPVDGAADVAQRWAPKLGHPEPDGVYSLPLVEGGLRETEARALVIAWLDAGAAGGEAEFARRTLGGTTS